MKRNDCASYCLNENVLLNDVSALLLPRSDLSSIIT